MGNKAGMGERSFLKIARITAALEKRSMTAKELCAELFLSKSNTRHYVKYLRDKGVVRIAKWGRTEASFAPYYGLGGGADAPRPKRLTRHQNYIRYLAKIKEDDRYVTKLAKAKAKKIKPKVNELATWIPRRKKEEIEVDYAH